LFVEDFSIPVVLKRIPSEVEQPKQMKSVDFSFSISESLRLKTFEIKFEAKDFLANQL
jgi:hypothetical protein